MRRGARSPLEAAAHYKWLRKVPWAEFSGGMSEGNATEGSGTMPEQTSRNLAWQPHTALQKMSSLSTRSYRFSAPGMTTRQTLHRIEMQQSGTALVLSNATQLTRDMHKAPISAAAKPCHIPHMQLMP